MVSDSPSTPSGIGPSASTSSLAALSSRQRAACSPAPGVGGWKSTMPSTPRRGAGAFRAQGRSEPIRVVGDQDQRRAGLLGAVGVVPAQLDGLALGPSVSVRVSQQRPQLRLAVVVLADRLGVDAERDVVDEDPAVDLAQVYITLAPIDEGVEGADHVFAVDPEVEGEVVARPRGDAGVGKVVLGRDRRHQRLRAVSAGHRQAVGAPLHRRPHQLFEVLARCQLDRLEAAPLRLRRRPTSPARPSPDQGLMNSTGWRGAGARGSERSGRKATRAPTTPAAKAIATATQASPLSPPIVSAERDRGSAPGSTPPPASAGCRGAAARTRRAPGRRTRRRRRPARAGSRRRRRRRDRQRQAAAEDRQDGPERRLISSPDGGLAERGEDGRHRRLRGRRRHRDAAASTSRCGASPAAADHGKLWFGAAAGLAAARRRPAVAARRSRGLASLGLASAFANLVAKPLTTRRRPEREELEVLARRHVPMPRSSSFPSGHTASAFAFATGAGPAQPRSRCRCGRWRRWSATPACIPVSTIPQMCSSVPSSASAPPSWRAVCSRVTPSQRRRSWALPAQKPQAARGSGAAADQRLDDRRRLRQLAALDLLQLEPRGGDRRDRVAVAVAAVAEEAPGPLEPVLPAGQSRDPRRGRARGRAAARRA